MGPSQLDKYDYIWLLAFVLIMTMVSFFHEQAHDEAQAWNIARSAIQLWDLPAHARYDGHTLFWYVLLWPFTKTGDPVWMKVIGLSLSFFTALLLLRDKPFPRTICILVIFGYFILYEYSIVVRPYIVALFLSACVASLFKNGCKYFPIYIVLCSLISYTSAFGIVLSFAFVVLSIIECYDWQSPTKRKNGTMLVGVLIYFGVCTYSAIEVILPIIDSSEGTFEMSILMGEKIQLSNAFLTVTTAVFPQFDRLPFEIDYFFTQTEFGKFFIALAAIAVAAALAVYLSARPQALVAFIVAVILLSAAVVYQGSGSARHLGHLFIAALTICWALPGLKRFQKVTEFNSNSRGASVGLRNHEDGFQAKRAVNKVSNILIIFALIYHVAIGAGAAVIDTQKQLTPWQSVESYLRANNLDNYPLLIDNVTFTTPLLANFDSTAYDVPCGCWTNYRDRNRSFNRALNTDIEREWCGLVNSGIVPLGLFTLGNWKPNDNFEIITTFEPGFREVAIPPILASITDRGVEWCQKFK